MSSFKIYYWSLGCFIVLIILFFWFNELVDTAYVERCVYCKTQRTVFERHLLGCLVSRNIIAAREPFFERIAKDLGAPCPHSYGTRLVVAKKRGLVWPTYNFSGTISLTSDAPDWYEKNISAIISGLKEQNPDLPRVFLNEILLKSDYAYLHLVIDSMSQFVPPEDMQEVRQELE
jgi:hypothetical protein